MWHLAPPASSESGWLQTPCENFKLVRSNVVVPTPQYKMRLVCAKIVVIDSCNFELAHLRKEKAILDIWQLSSSLLLQFFIAQLLVMKALKDQWYVDISLY